MIVLGSHEKFAWGCFYLELLFAKLDSVQELSSVKAPRNKQMKWVIFCLNRFQEPKSQIKSGSSKLSNELIIFEMTVSWNERWFQRCVKNIRTQGKFPRKRRMQKKLNYLIINLNMLLVATMLVVRAKWYVINLLRLIMITNITHYNQSLLDDYISKLWVSAHGRVSIHNNVSSYHKTI